MDTENTLFSLAGRLAALLHTVDLHCSCLNVRCRMILRVLLLFSFSCVFGTFEVNVTQSFYQAEENDNITLEWRFTTTDDTSPKAVFFFCHMITNNKLLVLFHLRGGLEDPESQDEQFAGRVQCDKDVLREGRFRLHVFRLRIEDSGRYLCQVRTSYGGGFAKCHLNVTAARDQPETERPNTASRGRIALYCSLGLTAAAVLLYLVYHLPDRKKISQSPTVEKFQMIRGVRS